MAEKNLNGLIIEGNEICRYEGNDREVIVPEGIIGIKNRAFINSSIEKISLPEGIEKIEQYAFTGTNLKKMIIPNSVKFIGYNAFGNCYLLNEIILSDSMQQIGGGLCSMCKSLEKIYFPKQLEKIDDSAFYNCESLQEVRFTDSLKIIGHHAFSGCSSLKDVILPSAFQKIGKFAFSYCDELTEIHIPANTFIERHGFDNCKSLNKICLTGEFEQYDNESGKNKKWSDDKQFAEIPETVTSIEAPDVGYDSFPGKLQNKALIGFIETYMRGEHVNEKVKDKYFQVIKRQQDYTQYISRPLCIGFLMQEKYIKRDQIDPLINLSTQSGDIEQAAKLLKYKHNNFTKAGVDNSNKNSPDIKKLFGIKKKGDIYQTARYSGMEPEIEFPEFMGDKKISGIGDCSKSAKDHYETGLTKVTIPEGYKFIGNNAFKGCKALREVILPASLEEIRDEVFSGCTSLETIFLPEGCSSIGKGAFAGCTSLREINIPSSVRYISEEVFSECISLERITLPDGCKSIGNNAFKECKSLKEVILPSSLLEIGKGAFERCASLREVTIPSGVNKINDEVFKFCSTLEKVILPEECNSMGKEAFMGCSSLRDFTVPSYIEDINDELFSYTPLEKIVLPEGCKSICNGAFRKCESLHEIIIPSSITMIGTEAFQGCTSLHEINICEGCTYIMGRAFAESGLKEITVPESVEVIGQEAFEGCAEMEEARIPANVKSWDKFYPAFIWAGMFRKCKSLKRVIIYGEFNATDPLTGKPIKWGGWISDRAFNDVEVIEAPNVPYSAFLDNFKDKALIGFIEAYMRGDYVNESLKEEYFAALAHDYDISRFMQRPLMADFIITEKLISPEEEDTYIKKANTVVDIGSSEKHQIDEPEPTLISDKQNVHSEANAGNQDNKKKTQKRGKAKLTLNPEVGKNEEDFLSDSIIELFDVKKKGKDYFAGRYCGDETEIEYPVSIGENRILGIRNCTANINDETDSKLLKVTIPEGYKLIGNKAFKGCNALQEVNLPSSIEEIGMEAFENCRKNLRRISIPESCKKIGKRAFKYCRELEEINIPFGVENIEEETFELCTEIRRISIPESCKKIGKKAFYGCINLEEINIPASIEEIGEEAFRDCKLKRISIPEGCKKIGKRAFDMYGTVDEINIPSSVESIGEEAFACGVKKIILPKGIKSIDKKVFKWCGFEKIDIPSSVESIGEEAFAENILHCKEIIIPEGCKSIGKGAFKSCWELQKIDIPSSVEEIGASAFQDCRNLVEARIPANVKSLDLAQQGHGNNGMFKNCWALHKVIIYGEFNATDEKTKMPIKWGGWISERAFEGVLVIEALDVPYSAFPDSFKDKALIGFIEAYMRGEHVNEDIKEEYFDAIAHEKDLWDFMYRPLMAEYILKEKLISSEELDSYIERAKALPYGEKHAAELLKYKDEYFSINKG